MKKLLLFFLLFNGILLTAQNSPECEKFLSQEIKTNTKADILSINRNIYQLQQCGLKKHELDFFLQGPILSTLIVGMSNHKKNDEKLTYGDLFEKIIQIKNTPNYQKAIKYYEFAQRKADIKNWEEDRKRLIELEVSEDVILQIHTFLKENHNPGKTYQEVFTSFEKKPAEAPKKASTNKISDLVKNPGNVDYSELLKEAQQLNKPLLIYFCGYACVNCKKMEALVFNDDQVYQRLKNDFLFVSLYVDDRAPLSSEEQIKYSSNDKKIKTVGNKNAQLQLEKFKTNSQPFFVIIDSEGKTIEKTGYQNSVVEFQRFLNSAK